MINSPNALLSPLISAHSASAHSTSAHSTSASPLLSATIVSLFALRLRMTSASGLPEVTYPPSIDSRHQGPKITVTAALCLCLAGVVLATRLLIRWPWPKLFGLDDGAAIAASVCNPASWVKEADMMLMLPAAICSSPMDAHIRCCIARPRYSVGPGT